MPADQARPWPLLAALLLSGCAVPPQLNLRTIWRDASGANAEARLPPPGLDRPFPNLASVPPVPERPDFAARQAITRGLEAERALAAEQLAPGRRDAALSTSPIPGEPAIPARPPGPPPLARAAVVPWTTTGAAVPIRPTPATAPASAPPGAPTEAPAAPPPELITPGAVPELPSADLLAPPPPR